MQPYQGRLRMLSIALISILCFACSELPGVSGPSSGAIQISATVSGESIDRDPDGFTVSIDDGGTIRLPVTGLTLKDISVGTHSVKIGDLAPNCSVSGTNPRTVEVAANGDIIAVPFGVMCQPNVGSLRISAVTTGDEVSEAGYGFVAPSNRHFTIPANGTVTIPDVRAGVLNLSLDNVAANCDHLGSPVRPTQIVFGTTTEVVFTLHCVATGRFQITTTTSGIDADGNGYLLDISLPAKGMQSQRLLPTSGTTEIAGLPPGVYSLRLSDIANNCSAERSVFSAVTLAAAQATAVAFDLTCAATKQIAYMATTGSGPKIRIVRSNGADNFELRSQIGSNIDPDWSPDGTRMAFTSDRDGRREIYVMDSIGGNAVRLTNVAGSNYRPAWSADGKKISFVSERDGNAQIYVMDADGENQVRLTNVGVNDAPSWSPDGRQIAFQSDRDGSQRIWIMNADGSAPFRLASSISGDRQPAWSPDGKKIAFSRTPSLAFRDIYMSDVDGSSLTQISFNYPDASDPAWAPDGQQLAFSATHCTEDYYYYYYYSNSTCEVDILLARTEGTTLPATPVLATGYNPAWRR